LIERGGGRFTFQMHCGSIDRGPLGEFDSRGVFAAGR
jgi:hypothetical protein